MFGVISQYFDWLIHLTQPFKSNLFCPNGCYKSSASYNGHSTYFVWATNESWKNNKSMTNDNNFIGFGIFSHYFSPNWMIGVSNILSNVFLTW